MSFEHISEPARRVVYSCEYAMTQYERAEAHKRAKSLTRAAIRAEDQAKRDAQIWRGQAVGGSLRGMARFIILADEYDDAVLRRRACERIERGYL